MVFGFGKKKQNTGESIEKPERGFFHYIGEHKRFPQDMWRWMKFYQDRFEIENYSLVIPYSSIVEVSNLNERRMHDDAATFGFLGLLWQKHYSYTVIDYLEAGVNQKIIIDFGDGANYTQGLIYRKMLEAKKKTDSTLQLNCAKPYNSTELKLKTRG